MLATIIAFLAYTEPIWLLVLLLYSAYRETQIHHMAQIEFDYDKEWNERRRERVKKAKKPEFENLTEGEGK